MLFEIKEVDRRFYEDELRNRLPDRIIDCHTHVKIIPNISKDGPADQRLVTWPARVANTNSIEDLTETYRLMFPGKRVTPLIFSGVQPIDRIEDFNEYTKSAAAQAGVPSLLYVHPALDPEVLEEKLTTEKRQGIKVYLNNAPSYIPGDEVRIFDFLPHEHLRVLDRLGLIVMLHIPRPQRLKDRVNIAQILEIEEKYRNLHLILAHVGRAYCNEDVGDAFDILSKTDRLVFDVSANTSAWVFARAMETMGPKRLLFGSDLPISRMRMRRICENGVYVNIVPKSMYGDVSGDKNMREAVGAEAEALSFFMYEEIRSLIQAADKTGLSVDDLEDLFYRNAKLMLEKTGYTFAG